MYVAVVVGSCIIHTYIFYIGWWREAFSYCTKFAFSHPVHANEFPKGTHFAADTRCCRPTTSLPALCVSMPVCVYVCVPVCVQHYIKYVRKFSHIKYAHRTKDIPAFLEKIHPITYNYLNNNKLGRAILKVPTLF